MDKLYGFTLILYLNGSVGKDRTLLWKVFRTLLANGTARHRLNSTGITECIMCKNLDWVKEKKSLEAPVRILSIDV